MKAHLTRSIRIASIVFTIAALALAGFGGSAKAESSTPATATNDSFTTVNATVGDDMRITLDRYSAPAGIVHFLVTNTGAVTHELVVLETDLAATQLVADPEQAGKVVEEIHMGETGDISAGRFSGLALPLGAGHYVILCNEIGHYMAGMRIDFTVTAAVVNVSLDDSMSVTLDQNVIYAGPVLFAVSNRGAAIHEFVVLATDVPANLLPFDPQEPTKVSEDANIGETGDITALRFSGLTLDLAPGVYTVICNESGHFMAGMHAILTVLAAPGGDE